VNDHSAIAQSAFFQGQLATKDDRNIPNRTKNFAKNFAKNFKSTINRYCTAIALGFLGNCRHC